MSLDTATEPLAILSQTRFFAALDETRLGRVAVLGRLEEHADGEAIYRVGEPAQRMYVLVRGLARMTVSYHGRHAPAGDLLRRGDVFGWAALTPDCNRRIATVSCLAPCLLLSLDGGALLALMEQDHTLGYRVTTQLTRLMTSTLSAFAGG